MQPGRIPDSRRKIQDRLVFRMTRMGGRRRWLFLPFLVLRRSAGHHAALHEREIANARAAAANPFWADLAVRSFPIAGHSSVSWRYEQVTRDDHATVAGLVERLLERAAAARRTPMAGLLERSPLFRELPKDMRARLRKAARGQRLPLTGMHGDFHLYNFCKARGGEYVLLDWEHADPRGSFVLDYVDFHVSTTMTETRKDWLGFLSHHGPGGRRVWRAAERLGLDADLLWFLFVQQKLSMYAQRHGGLEALRPEVRSEIRATLHRHAGAVGREAEAARARATRMPFSTASVATTLWLSAGRCVPALETVPFH